MVRGDAGVTPKILFQIDKYVFITNSWRCQEVKMSEVAVVNGSRGRLLQNEHDSRHFMAVWLLKMHQIFMLAFAGL